MASPEGLRPATRSPTVTDVRLGGDAGSRCRSWRHVEKGGKHRRCCATGRWRDPGISLEYAGVGKQFGHAISAIVSALLHCAVSCTAMRIEIAVSLVQNTAAAKMLRIMLRKLELRLEVVA